MEIFFFFGLFFKKSNCKPHCICRWVQFLQLHRGWWCSDLILRSILVNLGAVLWLEWFFVQTLLTMRPTSPNFYWWVWFWISVVWFFVLPIGFDFGFRLVGLICCYVWYRLFSNWWIDQVLWSNDQILFLVVVVVAVWC